MNLGEKMKYDDPPPLPNLGKIRKLGKFLNFGNPHQKKNISLKHLKLPKNHFKTNLFFVQPKHLKSTFTFGKTLKIRTPPYQKVQILNFGLFPLFVTYFKCKIELVKIKLFIWC